MNYRQVYGDQKTVPPYLIFYNLDQIILDLMMGFDIHFLPGYLLFIVSLFICFRLSVRAGWIVLIAAYLLAFINGNINLTGVAFLALDATLLLLAVKYLTGWKRVIAHLAFFVLSIFLISHQLPGFHNLPVFSKIRFTPDAAPFSMYLNFDKSFVGFILFTCLMGTEALQKYDAKKVLKAVIAPLAAIVTVCLVTAWALHFVAWEPKLLPEVSWIWALNNLLLVAVTEEVLFRGYLQGYLGNMLFDKRIVPLIISSLLFAVVHTTGGWPLMLLAFIAGLGYGVAYNKGGIMAAVFTHFGFNLLHFLLFTYPMLGRH